MLTANVRHLAAITVLLIAAMFRLFADGGETLSRFCAFRDCREYIDATLDGLVHPWDLDTPLRARSMVESLVKEDVRRKSIDALSANGVEKREIENLLVFEYKPEVRPYRALYCGEKIYFIKQDTSGRIFIQRFDNETARAEAARLRKLLAGCRSRGDLSAPARGSSFLFFTDLKSGKSVLIHEPAITGNRRNPSLRRLPESVLAPLYDGAMALVKELGSEWWK